MIVDDIYNAELTADDLIETIYGSEDWFALLREQRDQLILMATRQIERLKPKYPKADPNQTGNFPVRTNNETLGDGLEQVREAIATQAFYLFQHSDEIQTAQKNRIEGVKGETLGKVGQTQTGYNPMASISPKAIQVLAPYIDLTVRATR